MCDTSKLTLIIRSHTLTFALPYHTHCIESLVKEFSVFILSRVWHKGKMFDPHSGGTWFEF